MGQKRNTLNQQSTKPPEGLVGERKKKWKQNPPRRMVHFKRARGWRWWARPSAWVYLLWGERCPSWSISRRDFPSPRPRKTNCSPKRRVSPSPFVVNIWEWLFHFCCQVLSWLVWCVSPYPRVWWISCHLLWLKRFYSGFVLISFVLFLEEAYHIWSAWLSGGVID